MVHNHNHGGNSNFHSLVISIFLNSIIVLAKLIGGIIANSLTLISDAMHDLTDVVSLILALVGEILGKKKADTKHTFAFQKAEVIIAFVNSLALILVGIYIIYEAIVRFGDKQLEINGYLMLVIAVIGFFGNLISVLFLHKEKDENLNKKVAYLHILFDVVASIIVVISGVLIYYTHLYIIDLITSLVISIFVIVSGFGILKKSLHILMQGVPEGIDLVEMNNYISSFSGITDVHDLHVWNINSNDIFLISHLVIDKQNSAEDVIKDLNEKIEKKYNIHHTSFQVVTKNCC
ncbi:MAG: cation diffusion facilitator family transporter [Candidatus Gracilibacteria bacterium]